MRDPLYGHTFLAGATLMKRATWIWVPILLSLSACERHPPRPTAAPSLPRVTRATLTLRTPADLDAHGDVVIPRAAITKIGGIPGVFVLSAHGRARFRLIKIGATTSRQAEILSGLSGDETLVLPPFRHVYDGSPVDQNRPSK